MERSVFNRWLRVLFIGAFAVQAASAGLRPAHGYTPQSPEVTKAVARGIKFLESDAAKDRRLGARALIGLALLKHGASSGHPKVVEAVQEIRTALSNVDDPAKFNADIYSTGLSIIFLVTLDAGKYSPEIKALQQSLLARQKSHGGWGYPAKKTGDTSMTQYGVLSAWEAKQAGYPMPLESIEAVTIWLLKTQDPSGAYSYQGTVSDTFQPVAQIAKDIRHSMVAAGLGSLYICADMLGMVKPARKDDDLPSALKELKSKKETGPLTTRIDPRLVREAQARGNRWMAENYKINPGGWICYYLYALERYCSFREAAEGKSDKEPKWYNDGVRYLIDSQASDGHWHTQASPTADTAFAVLFLLRSTKKSIQHARGLGAGTLVGGRGLPRDTSRVELRQGKVVPRPLLGPAEALLAALNDSSGSKTAEAIEALAELPPKQSRVLVNKHKEKLRQLVAGRAPEARIAAVRALGRTGDLNHVPTLIYALTDPDPEVVRQARDALRRISRRFGGFGLPDEPSQAERTEVIEKWKAWYLAIRPDAVFED